MEMHRLYHLLSSWFLLSRAFAAPAGSGTGWGYVCSGVPEPAVGDKRKGTRCDAVHQDWCFGLEYSVPKGSGTMEGRRNGCRDEFMGAVDEANAAFRTIAAGEPKPLDLDAFAHACDWLGKGEEHCADVGDHTLLLSASPDPDTLLYPGYRASRICCCKKSRCDMAKKELVAYNCPGTDGKADKKYCVYVQRHVDLDAPDGHHIYAFTEYTSNQFIDKLKDKAIFKRPEDSPGWKEELGCPGGKWDPDGWDKHCRILTPGEVDCIPGLFLLPRPEKPVKKNWVDEHVPATFPRPNVCARICCCTVNNKCGDWNTETCPVTLPGHQGSKEKHRHRYCLAFRLDGSENGAPDIRLSPELLGDSLAFEKRKQAQPWKLPGSPAKFPAVGFPDDQSFTMESFMSACEQLDPGQTKCSDDWGVRQVMVVTGKSADGARPIGLMGRLCCCRSQGLTGDCSVPPAPPSTTFHCELEGRRTCEEASHLCIRVSTASGRAIPMCGAGFEAAYEKQAKEKKEAKGQKQKADSKTTGFPWDLFRERCRGLEAGSEHCTPEGDVPFPVLLKEDLRTEFGLGETVRGRVCCCRRAVCTGLDEAGLAANAVPDDAIIVPDTIPAGSSILALASSLFIPIFVILLLR